VIAASSHSSTATSAAGSPTSVAAAAREIASRTTASTPGSASHSGDSVNTSTVTPDGARRGEAVIL
jgi:hypothetical protein